jgi:hypothetical protein
MNISTVILIMTAGKLKTNYIEVVNNSQVINYVMQLFISLNNPRRATFDIKFAKNYNQVLACNVDTRAETMNIQPYHTLMFMFKDIANQVDSFSENLRQFAQECKSDMTFQEFAEKFKMKLEEVILYARHFIYYKKGILIHRLDQFSYFMLKGEQSVAKIMLAEEHNSKDSDSFEGANICEFLSTHRSWAEIVRHFDPTESSETCQKLSSILFQLLVKRTAYEVLMYLLPADEYVDAAALDEEVNGLEPDSNVSFRNPSLLRTSSEGAKAVFQFSTMPEAIHIKHATTMVEVPEKNPQLAAGLSELESRVIDACKAGRCVKEMLALDIVQPHQINELINTQKFKPFFKY